MFAVWHDERYFLTEVNEAYPIGTTHIFNPSRSPLDITALSSHSHTGALVDRDEDKLFFLGRQTGPSGPCVYQFDPEAALGTANIEGQWKSGTFSMSYPVNMGAAQVIFEPSTFNSCLVSFYSDDQYRFTKVVEDMEPFRLPSGFLSRDWYIDIITDSEIHGVYVAETMEELRGAGAG
jgi:hypothetical protein